MLSAQQKEPGKVRMVGARAVQCLDRTVREVGGERENVNEDTILCEVRLLSAASLRQEGSAHQLKKPSHFFKRW